MVTEALLDVFKNLIQFIGIGEKVLDHKMEIDKKVRFLTFNYRDTVGGWYYINPSKVTFIHNAASQNGRLFVPGHGIGPSV